MKTNTAYVGTTPRYVRVYDNGGDSPDRYTVVFTRLDKKGMKGRSFFLGMSPHLGYAEHGDVEGRIDYPAYSHLGKKISFEALPLPCQKLARETYISLWGGWAVPRGTSISAST